VNNAVHIISVSGTQERRSQPEYRVFAANLKRATAPGLVLGSVDLHIPAFDLHLHCAWLRDQRGNERVSMPRSKVETPGGHMHLKTLARWGTSQSEQRFQRAALAAIHTLLARSEGSSP
jgi:hypothetical protein